MQSQKILGIVAASICLLLAGTAQAQVQITEVAPWSSGNSPILHDWFELTNTGAASVDITGWRMNDDTVDFASGAPMVGITAIGAGESVIFIENGDPAAFKTLWFGAPDVPASLQIGTYTMSGVGLSTSADAVRVFDSGGAQQAIVTFGSSPGLPGPFPTFDNAAGVNGAITLQSAVGVNGAFLAAGDSNEIGSPGTTVSVPEPGSALLLVLGAGALATAVQRRLRAWT